MISRGDPPWVPLALVERFIPLAEVLGVSEVARGPGGFLRAYRRAKGRPSGLSDAWKAKRSAFLARHVAQLVGEPRLAAGLPTRRVLALLMWAGMPPGWDASRVRGLANRL